MNEDVGRIFDGISGVYDEEHRRAVPCFEELYGAVPGLIPAGRGETFGVLDLGSGTGLLAAMVGKAFPKAEVTLADFSEGMMHVAESRLAGEPDGKFTFHLTDYVKEPLPGRYEVVVSALSLHHVEDGDRKKVLRKVYEALEEGGIFINADQTEAGHHGNHEAHHEGDVSAAPHHPKTCESSLEEQLVWMNDVGFTSVECAYENGRFVVYSGRKETA